MRSLLLLILVPAALFAQLPVVRVGTVIDGDSTYLHDVRSVFKGEIKELLEGEFIVEFPPKLQLSGDFEREKVEDCLNLLLGNPRVDVVIAMGVIASNEAAGRDALPKPVIAPFVVSPQMGGADNLSPIAYPTNVGRDLELLHEITPFRHLAYLVDAELYKTVPLMARHIENTAREMGAIATPVLVGSNPDKALSHLPSGTDAVYITPLVQLDKDQLKKLVSDLHARGLITFSLMGKREVELGVVAARAPAADLDRIARRTALNLQKILLGAKPGDLPSDLFEADRFTFNMEAAKAVGLSPTWAIMTEAELIADCREQGADLSLRTAINEAMCLNLDLLVSNMAVTAGCSDVMIARSKLLPHIDLFGLGRVIDKQRARALNGVEPEYAIQGTALLSQVLYSDKALAGWQIEKFLQSARCEERSQVLLDVIFGVASTYVNLLRAKTLLKIQQNNLNLTRNHLEDARHREQIGVSRSNEVYRWESELAVNKRGVIDTKAQVRVLEVALNRLLQREPTCAFQTEEVSPQSLLTKVGHRDLSRYLTTPEAFDRFRAFQIKEGLATSPTIKELDAKICAQRRALTTSKRAFYTPEVRAIGGITERFLREGEGSRSPPGFPQNNALDWLVGVEVKFPLLTGGEKMATKDKRCAELEQLLYLRMSASQQIEEQIYSSLEQAAASYLGIDLAQESAVAAGQNLKLVTEGYRKGAVTMIDLLDAQNALLVAESQMANSSFDFSLDLLTVMRSVGRFDFLLSDCEQRAWFDKLDRYFYQYPEVNRCTDYALSH